jgi:cell division protein FtsB
MGGARLPAFAETVRSRIFVWRRWGATGAVGALALGMFYGVVCGHNGLTSFMHKRAEAKSLDQQMVQLRTENDRLRGHVERLQTDPGEIEHQAHADLRYVNGNEIIYTTAPDTESPAKTKQ